MKTLFNFNETMELIKSGKILTIAGDVELLKTLPKGNWIGGSIPYFMSENGGLCTKDLFQVTVLPDYVKIKNIKLYSAQQLEQIPSDYPVNGLSFILIPAGSEAHLLYAQNCSSCPSGWRRCNGSCLNVQNDRLNCGSCGRQCSANQTCSAGHCCPKGKNWCNGQCIRGLCS